MSYRVKKGKLGKVRRETKIIPDQLPEVADAHFWGNPDKPEGVEMYAGGTTSVHLYFPNDLDAGPQITNHIAVNVSGFSDGFGAFQQLCASAR